MNCTIDDCDEVVKARGMCWRHYDHWRYVNGPLGSRAGVHLSFERLWNLANPENQRDLAVRVGVSMRAIVRWKRDGVPADSADAVACALGLHPSAIWPEWEHIG